MNHGQDENLREEEAVNRAKWLLGIWSGSSSWVGAGGDVFAARRGFDILVLLPLSLSISHLPGGTLTLGWVLRSIGWDWSDFAEEAGEKDLCTGWNDRGQRCGGSRCRGHRGWLQARHVSSWQQVACQLSRHHRRVYEDLSYLWKDSSLVQRV